MDALSLPSKILDGYKDYIQSFIDIHDDDIREKVEESLRTRMKDSASARAGSSAAARRTAIRLWRKKGRGIYFVSFRLQSYS